QGRMIGKAHISHTETWQIAGEEAIDQSHTLTHVKRLIHREAGTIEHRGMVAAGVECDDNRAPGHEGDDDRPEQGGWEERTDVQIPMTKVVPNSGPRRIRLPVDLPRPLPPCGAGEEDSRLDVFRTTRAGPLPPCVAGERDS